MRYLIHHSRQQAAMKGHVTVMLVAGLWGMHSSAVAQSVRNPTPTGRAVVVDQAASVQSPLASAVGDNAIADMSAIEYLTRGPLHEAFAEPYSPDLAPNPSVLVQPPEPIDEVPPEFRPEGNNVAWIPGYWSWEDDRNDFLWVSGVWRQLPPRSRWVPGYWNESIDGYRWISGFWTSTKIAEVRYLPLPPVTLEAGPSSPPPSTQHFYVPGVWIYELNSYRWQPGFWSPIQEGWVWVPAQHIWTPRGAIYRRGYWDYDVTYRGIVFTPIYFRQPLYRSTTYTYRPRYTIDTGLSLFVHLFVNPIHGRYHFGDYYGSQYANIYQPWVVRFQDPRYYDPFYTHYRFQPRNEQVNVINWVNTQYRYFQGEERYRPPRTIEAQRQFVRENRDANLPPTIMRLATFGESLENVVEQRDLPFEFRSLDREEVLQYVDANVPLRALRQSRRELESQPVDAGEGVVMPGGTVVGPGSSVRLEVGPDSPALDPRIRSAIVEGVLEKENIDTSTPQTLSLPPVSRTMPAVEDPSRSIVTEPIDPIEQERPLVDTDRRDARPLAPAADMPRFDARDVEARELDPAQPNGVRPETIRPGNTQPPGRRAQPARADLRARADQETLPGPDNERLRSADVPADGRPVGERVKT